VTANYSNESRGVATLIAIKNTYTYHSRFIPEGERHLRYTSKIPIFYQNELAMRNTEDVTGGKPAANVVPILYGMVFIFMTII
jgi:hypothetical protein